jgi:hypothetical protein
MTAELPSSVPGRITAGDTAKWQRNFAGYPASQGWALQYTLISKTAVFNFSGATADGDAFDVTIPASTTNGWAADDYTVQEYVSKGSERFTIGTTLLRILPNIAAITTGGLDTRSHARKLLDAIEAWLESQAPVAGAMEINGRKISYYPIAELLKLRDRYRMEVINEVSAANGGTRGTRILTRL